ncbi:bacillithiol biosynthesis cysteine-adding enzyme BshC [Paenimyroides aestuarii]|uniref:Putative cysteine ligase BshC n=1 Tax=Paenimyroides aestuarii TaxID=2968490 RepID=A0ABY5NQE8_9FLAO|nr:bacillithiol biosynthesis cysteine-adding enzyme BshC [Paenimyroides aestuarii]UUV20750.1 bacillithiol biosynthesis cysteine-adding enzyme BshC [Paenimyroides aestuarii]
MFQIPYEQTGYFSKLMIDYLGKNNQLSSLYNRFPSIENFKDQILEKQTNFSSANREILAESLQNQYAHFSVTAATQNNINRLKDTTTFTVVTGHQLNLFTGPLYFLYKIVSTINLCKELKKTYPEYDFVPIYWMATEDHDFDEINFFNFNQKKFQWNKEVSGPVGRLNTDGLQAVFEEFKKHLPLGNHANELANLFENAYLKHHNLADATRFLANELFGNEGLVIIDGDDVALKKLFIPHIKEELTNQSSFKEVEKSYAILKDAIIQVNPREINLFFIEDGLRERIVFEDDFYKVLNTELQFTREELLHLVDTNPEKFSPNVILRPLYQEVILPNLCYIGGGGELAYWLELKEVFTLHNITFPMLLLRNSVLLATEKQNQKRAKLNLSWEELFLKTDEFQQKKTKDFAQNIFDFEQQKQFLKEQFAALKEVALQTNKSFIGAVNAQEVKQIKGLENLEKRYFKAERLKNQDHLDRMLDLKIALFPNNSLQERVDNFSTFYVDYGKEMMDILLENLNPLEQHFAVVVL